MPVQRSRQPQDALKHRVIQLLEDAAEDAAKRIETVVQRSPPCGNAESQPRGCSVQQQSAVEHRNRKRKRSSPVLCLSAVSLALPRTPTQDLLPFLHGELRSHQLEGVKWLGNLHRSGMNGILSDELSHDRQVAVVGLMALLKNNGVGGPFLVVASSEALDSWAGELNRLLQSGLLIHRFNAAAGSRDMLGLLCSGQGANNQLTRVVLMSHETFLAEKDTLQRCAFRHVVLDASVQSLPPPAIDFARALLGRPSIFLLTSCHPARGANLDLQSLWPVLLLVHPNSWQEIRGAAQELLALLPPPAAEEMSKEIKKRVQGIIDLFVLCRTAEEVDLMQPRRDTAINLYDFFSAD